jgi:hypothetical protein
MAKYACAIVLFAAFSLFATNTNADSLHKAPLGTKVAGTVDIGGAQFALPAGDWVVMGRHRRNAGTISGSPAPPIGSVYLGEARNGVLARTVIAEANTELNTGWSRWQDCDRKDMLHVTADRNFNPRDQECWWINHYTQSLGRDAFRQYEHFNEAYRYMDENGIRRPATMLALSYIRVDGGQFLNIRYAFNPELAGFAPAKQSWRENDWHRDRYRDDPKKIAYVDALKGWGEAMLPFVRQGVRKNLSAGVSLPRVPME